MLSLNHRITNQCFGQPQSFFLKSPQRKPFLRRRLINVLDSVEVTEIVVFLTDILLSACVSTCKQDKSMVRIMNFFMDKKPQKGNYVKQNPPFGK